MPDEPKTDGAAVKLGRWLRERRLAYRFPSGRHPTQAWLAERAGLPRETICSIERGRYPRPENLLRILKALGSNAAELPAEFTSNLWRNQTGDLLRARRKERGRSLTQCADAAGISASTLSRFERGIGHCAAIARGKEMQPYALIRNFGYARALGFRTSVELGRFLPDRWGRERLVYLDDVETDDDDDDDGDDWEYDNI